MLNLYTIKRVAEIIDVPQDVLMEVADDTESYVNAKTVIQLALIGQSVREM
jgi:hypothetical protein